MGLRLPGLRLPIHSLFLNPTPEELALAVQEGLLDELEGTGEPPAG